jgi:prevent-host-death family protein
LAPPEEPPTTPLVALHPKSEPSLVLGGRVAPADVPGLCGHLRALLEAGHDEMIVCDVGALVQVDAVVVDALCRLQLTARRAGRRLLVRHTPCELAALLALMGLTDVLAPECQSDNLITEMDSVSATEAARRFSDLLDAVEHRGESFLISRKGRAVAVVSPARPRSGKELKQFLRRHPPDEGWGKERREMRQALFVEERSWRG